MLSFVRPRIEMRRGYPDRNEKGAPPGSLGVSGVGGVGGVGDVDEASLRRRTRLSPGAIRQSNDSTPRSNATYPRSTIYHIPNLEITPFRVLTTRQLDFANVTGSRTPGIRYYSLVSRSLNNFYILHRLQYTTDTCSSGVQINASIVIFTKRNRGNLILDFFPRGLKYQTTLNRIVSYFLFSFQGSLPSVIIASLLNHT